MNQNTRDVGTRFWPALFYVAILIAMLCAVVTFYNSRYSEQAKERAAARGAYENLQELKAWKRGVLQSVSSGAERFVQTFGCAPGAPQDLIDQPSPERLRILGCNKSPETGKNYQFISPETAKRLDGISFVHRWDGTYVIQYGGDQCTFLDAAAWSCPSLQ